jgi:hypothetical protein
MYSKSIVSILAVVALAAACADNDADDVGDLENTVIDTSTFTTSDTMMVDTTIPVVTQDTGVVTTTTTTEMDTIETPDPR